MKLLWCLNCRKLVQMEMGFKSCLCGNVRGRYLSDGMTIEVKLITPSKARIVGISNAFLTENGVGLDHPSFEGTLFKKNNSHIIIMYPFTTGDVVPIKDGE